MASHFHNSALFHFFWFLSTLAPYNAAKVNLYLKTDFGGYKKGIPSAGNHESKFFATLKTFAILPNIRVTTIFQENIPPRTKNGPPRNPENPLVRQPVILISWNLKNLLQRLEVLIFHCSSTFTLIAFFGCQKKLRERDGSQRQPIGPL